VIPVPTVCSYLRTSFKRSVVKKRTSNRYQKNDEGPFDPELSSPDDVATPC
jgi:hypothetical protein